MRQLPVAAHAYIGCAVLAAAGAAAPAVPPTAGTHWPTVLLLAGLYLACEQLRDCPLTGGRVPVGGAPARGRGMPPRWGCPVLLAGVFLLPPAAAALVAVPGALGARTDERSATARRVWHAAELALAAWAAAQVFDADGSHAVRTADFPYALLPAAAAATVYCAVLAALDGGILVAAERHSPRTAWRGLLTRSLAPHLVHGLAGLMMAVLWRSSYGPPAALLVLLPMYISCWVFAQYHRERAAHQATIRALVQAVDLKDRYTRGHSERVGRASVMIARELGMAEDRLEVLRFAGILHDVGKLGVPTRLLRKDGPLTPEERRVIELHPEYGHEIVRGIGFLGEARAAILHHHERIDGSGYPYGLTGHHIPEFARVVAVADAFDAMTSTRSYRRARPVATAVAELRRCAGAQFDPRMVRALAAALARHGWQPEVVTAGADGPATPPPRRGTVPLLRRPDPSGAPGGLRTRYGHPPRHRGRTASAGHPGRAVSRRTDGSAAAAPPGGGIYRDRAPRAVVLVYAAAGTLACLALGHTLWDGLTDPGIALAFGALIAVGELARWGAGPPGRGGAGALPGDRESAPLGAAGALAYALLGEVAGRPAAPGVLQTVAVVVAAGLVGLVPHVALGRGPALDHIARRVLTVGFAATCFQPLYATGRLADRSGDGTYYTCYLLGILALTALCDAVLAAALARARTGWPYGPLLRDELRALLGIGSAICATGLVIALATAVAGLWALPVFCLPLLLTQFSFRRYAAVRATYRQTIASLARATEIAGYTPHGHARRVAVLSRAVGRELGLGDADLGVLEYAALMHDIGQLSLLDPVPAGATAELPPEEQRRIALLGGAVVRQTGVPAEVAVIVERQADPFREQPLPARIVRAVNAYDDLAGRDGGPGGTLRALERLRLSTARDFEPQVVEALARVLARPVGPGLTSPGG